MILIHSPAYVPDLDEHSSIIHVTIISPKMRFFIDNALSVIFECDIVSTLSAKALYISSNGREETTQMLKSLKGTAWTFRIQWLTFSLMRQPTNMETPQNKHVYA